MRRLRVNEQHGPTLAMVASELEREAKILGQLRSLTPHDETGVRMSLLHRVRLLQAYARRFELRSRRARP